MMTGSQLKHLRKKMFKQSPSDFAVRLGWPRTSVGKLKYWETQRVLPEWLEHKILNTISERRTHDGRKATVLAPGETH